MLHWLGGSFGHLVFQNENTKQQRISDHTRFRIQGMGFNKLTLVCIYNMELKIKGLGFLYIDSRMDA